MNFMQFVYMPDTYESIISGGETRLSAVRYKHN